MLLEEGIERLRDFAPACKTVDVAALIADASVARDRLAALGAEGLGSADVRQVAPRIRFVA